MLRTRISQTKANFEYFYQLKTYRVLVKTPLFRYTDPVLSVNDLTGAPRMQATRTRIVAAVVFSALAFAAVLAAGAQLYNRSSASFTPSITQATVPTVAPAAGPLPIPSLGGALLGASDGLYRVDAAGRISKPLSGTDVRKILSTEQGWYFLSGRGILFSRDLVSFEERNAGIPVKVIKTYDNGQKAFAREIQEIKDIEADPYNQATLVICTKDEVYLSLDGGLNWKSIPSPAPQPGIKAVAVTSKPEGLIFVSHPIKGPFVRPLSGGSWREIGGELGKSDPANSNPDEISDIVVQAGPEGTIVWAANSFLPRSYRYDFASRRFVLSYRGGEDFASYESLLPRQDGLYIVSEGAVLKQVHAASGASGLAAPPQRAAAQSNAVLLASRSIPSQLNAIWMKEASGHTMALSELWLVDIKDEKPYRAQADGRHGFYLQTGFMVHEDSRAKYDAVMTDRNLDMVVVDVKDDYGRLRFEPQDPLVRSIGRWVSPLDIESFVKEMKAKGRYLVARVVVFKDQRLYESAGGAYAVWDRVENKPWQGYVNEKTELPASASPGAASGIGATAAAPATVTTRKYYEEYWVDPYSEKVWEYNIAIAKEIIARGFDEIQFDYIRFPTDGVNLENAQYRWKDAGMDMESALMSFLSYARKQIKAPISIDIYGANGWYRSGVRTGQDVELLSRYVDVICPMFYPSHFEQDFMAFEPAIQRPYRIYKIGTLRNSFISKKKTVIRPYLQAFFLNVRYDRLYYNPTYVSLQVDGIRDASNEGLTFWNNSGRYDDIPILKTTAQRRLAASGSEKAVLD